MQDGEPNQRKTSGSATSGITAWICATDLSERLPLLRLIRRTSKRQRMFVLIPAQCLWTRFTIPKRPTLSSVQKEFTLPLSEKTTTRTKTETLIVGVQKSACRLKELFQNFKNGPAIAAWSRLFSSVSLKQSSIIFGKLCVYSRLCRRFHLFDGAETCLKTRKIARIEQRKRKKIKQKQES